MGDTPTVRTSLASYFGSEYSRDLVSTAPNDLEMNFVAMGSETALAEMVTELYAARQPFLAYIYTLDVNFGRVDAETGELQQFEKLVYPRNPDQSANDPCFEDKKCQFAVAPIMKLANGIRARGRFRLRAMTASRAAVSSQRIPISNRRRRMRASVESAIITAANASVRCPNSLPIRTVASHVRG